MTADDPFSICYSAFNLDVHIGGMGHTHNEAGAAAAAAHHHHNDEIDVVEKPADADAESPSSSVKEHTHRHSHSHFHPHPLHDPTPSSRTEAGDAEKGLAKNGKTGTVEVNPDEVLAQLVGIAILEFGVVLHSTIIGLTLAVDDAFKTLFVVIIFHRTYHPILLSPIPCLSC